MTPPYVEARSILVGGVVLLVTGAAIPLVLQLLVPDGFSGGRGALLVLSSVTVASTVLLALGAAVIGAGLVLRALERAGVIGPADGRSDDR
ncbi:hypothetical protein [Aeromicrobium erythreum]|jgi:hypothetical protein|uniref:Uncharacterized protein n=1 Tax=Aeromicrobium erythreum TaxID=2041 RepID=A0A0U4B6K0_9ACTN|nr:hypothetical protein [Aeromicrobium erythreum]ALX03673.1 hypothetical protein AERYTH_02630 [Aeromicrobium erythreum]